MTKSIADIVKELLIDRQAPIISALDLQAMLLGIYAGIHPGSHQSRTRKQNPSESDISRAIQRLENARVVRRDPDFKGTHYQVFDVLEQSAEVVCCLVDPFIWVSHLSAMQLQGLTDRNPAALVLTRPDSQTWRQTAETLENRNPPTQQNARPLRQPRYGFPEKVRDRPILVHETRHPGRWERLGRNIRVATHGQTFLDMVVRPAWCGGISHVIETWEREAEVHLDQIIESVDEYAAKLPKVRAGYILNEVMGLTDERVLAWRSFAQRGSSQKLDPEKPFSSTYSDKWMLSLNA
jgi:hypothetical protein